MTCEQHRTFDSRTPTASLPVLALLFCSAPGLPSDRPPLYAKYFPNLDSNLHTLLSRSPLLLGSQRSARVLRCRYKSPTLLPPALGTSPVQTLKVTACLPSSLGCTTPP